MDLRSLLGPVVRRIENVVTRAIVSLVNDGARMQTVQVEAAGATRGGIERFQEYGFTSVPLEGAEAVVLWVGGRADHGLAVAVDDRRHRLTGLQPGEVAVYTDEGDSVVIKRGGTIEVKAATKIALSAPLVEVAGASDALAKGAQLNTAIANLGAAVSAALTAAAGVTPVEQAAPVVGSKLIAAAQAITAAVTVFQTAAQAALSTKAKVGG